MTLSKRAPIADRLAERSQRTEHGCIEYAGRHDKGGYGLIGYLGRDRQAHRVAWTLVHGPVPSGLKVLHRCDNPPCINPEHLWLGTQADNHADMHAKHRWRLRQSRVGDLNPNSRARKAGR